MNTTRKLAAALWLMTLCAAPAQTAVQAWVQRYGNLVDAYDTAVKVVTDTAGNVIVVGNTGGGAGVDDFLIITYSGAGVALWTNRYNGPGKGNDRVSAVAVDGSGNVFVTGSSLGTGIYDDYATVGYSAGGVPLWTNRYDSGQSYAGDQATGVAVDSSGNVFVTGSSPGSGSDRDYATIKYSGAGVPLWTNRYNGPGNGWDAAAAVAVDNSGNVLVTGSSQGSDSASGFATIKYSGAGVPLWTNRHDRPGSQSIAATALAVDGNGNVFVTGTAYVGDYETIKYSGAGVTLWTNRYDGPGNANGQAPAVAVDASGNVFVTGSSATINYSAAGVPLWTNSGSGTAIAVDGSGNVFVTGSSVGDGGWDYATIKYSGAGVVLWTNRYNGPANGDDFARAVAVDGSGNVVVTGDSDSDCLTIKYSGAGMPSWTNRSSGLASASGVATAVAVDSSGNVVVTGTSYGSRIAAPPGSGSQSDYATVAYSGAGVPLWTNRYNGPANWYDEAVAVAADGSGNVFVTGSSSVGDGGWDFATIKYSAAGVPLWTNRYNGPGNGDDYTHAMAVDSSGNVFVTGESPSGTNSDYATVAYSGAGVPLWTRRYNGPGNGHDVATAAAVDGSGNVFATGWSDGISSYNDYATIKYSAAGVPLWTQRYNGPANDVDEANAVAVDSSGNVFVTGLSWNGSSFDYATIKYSSSGVPLWTNRYAGPVNGYDSEATAVAVDRSGNVIVTGWSTYDGSSYEYVTIKYSGSGVALWTNRFGLGYSTKATVAVDTNNNVFVCGRFMTVAYSGAGVPLWTNRYPSGTQGTALAVDGSGNVIVTGSDSDYVTIKYSVAALSPIPLNYQIVGSQLVLSWTNAAFSLQAGLAAQGAYTNISGATSPHSNVFSGTQRYFRLKGN